MGSNAFNLDCFPNASAMVRQLGGLGVELMLSPYFNFVGPNATRFAAAERRGLLVLDNASFPSSSSSSSSSTSSLSTSPYTPTFLLPIAASLLPSLNSSTGSERGGGSGSARKSTIQTSGTGVVAVGYDGGAIYDVFQAAGREYMMEGRWC